jgi:hypothetical protein
MSAMTAAEARAVTAAIQAAPLSELLTRAYQITHLLHAGCPASVGTHPDARTAWETDTRAARALIDAEIARRIEVRDDLLRQAEDLLGDARCSMNDPGLSRHWGQQKRRVRDRILDLLAGA